MRIERDLGRLSEPFDVVVVGGGISGVSVAREAAGRGLRTLLLDKGDFGAGTSSATTKYLHGGIRYLEQLEFGVVRESLRERRIMALAAPHLVQPMRFLMPAWRWSTPPAPLLGAGVLTYHLLAFDRDRGVPPSLRMPRPTWLGRRAALTAVPWLQPEQLLGAFAYPDVLNVHPERLLLALLQSAVRSGAVALNHVRAAGFALDEDRVTGVEVVDALTGARAVARGRVVVNAGGPWADLVLQGLGRPVRLQVQRSKGVHVLTRPLGGTDAVLARAPDGHHVVVSPWMGGSFIGPTDTPLSGHPDDARAEREDVDLILSTVNATIGPPSARLSPSDVEAVTVGIRPLVVDAERTSYTASRRHELHDHRSAGVRGLWSISGGKWTTGRALGEEVVDVLLGSDELRGAATRRFDSRRAPAAGTFAWAQDAEPYLRDAVRSRSHLDLAADVRLHLARLYGTDAERVLDLVERDPALGARISSRAGRLDIAAQAVFAVTDEAARTLGDVVRRRLVLGTLGGTTEEELRTVGALVAPLLGWDDAALEAQVATEREPELHLARLRTPSP